MKSSNILFQFLATILFFLAISVPQLHANTEATGRRFLLQAYSTPPRAAMTCNKYPIVCRGKGSPGPNCCNKQCVNVLTDKLNCGKCGKKCKYSEMCCQGACVNPSVNEKHCGKCNNKCKKGGSCVYGLCSYA
ncbi:hypothetical protein Pint_09842 [Pistacia integerrima]|uniref:Uncharacterized protein n=1 Tax=Pistacia integerrima TaxID=434235 RepID=A0ACC0XM80_9ROSI|nr:hypothetical protein Pint_09842 [Pistacia integerrima]